MSRSDYGAILSTVIKDTSDAIREAKDSSALIAPSSWGSEIRSIVPPWKTLVDSIVQRTITSFESDVTSIGGYAFYKCQTLVSVNFPNATIAGSNAFYSCTSLVSVNIPLLTVVPLSFCNSATKLITLNCPLVTSIEAEGFYNCASLTTVDFPNVISVGGYSFGSCIKLASASFSQNVSFAAGAFYNCNSLKTLVLRANSVCSVHSGTFQNTPFNSGNTGGTLYVPQALISSYRSATNWSTILGYPNNKILPIEGSPYEE